MISSEVITESLPHNNLIGIKLEPDDSIGNVSELTEAIPDSCELSQSVEKLCKTRNGKFLLDL